MAHTVRGNEATMSGSAIVTGGASGIGRAIAAALVAEGHNVTVADLNGPGAEQVAEELTKRGPGEAGTGRLDLVFNNAGIAVGGAAEELTLEHWNRAIDVNLKGVVHGVHAAYPIMLEQGFGHIVNTASLAGLVPMPMGIPYTATKQAVVGLSLGLRAEAAGRGVRVSVICPGFVDTPLLTNINPDLPKTRMSGDAREDIRRAQPRLYPADKLARDIMRGVRKNRALIVAPASGRAAWRSTRLLPSGGVRAAQLFVDRLR